MSKEKQCARCKTWFDNSKMYCPNCHTYWRRSKQAAGWSAGILEVEKKKEEIQKLSALSSDGGEALSRWYVVCTGCGTEIPVLDGKKPKMCPSCDSPIDFFAKIIDRLAAQERAAEETAANDPVDPEPEEDKPKKRNPFGDRKRLPRIDNSGISFLCLNYGEGVRLDVPDEITSVSLGKGSELWSEFFSDPAFTKVCVDHGEVWHEATGWYYRALEGDSFHNARPLSQDMPIQLFDNDRLNLGDCRLRVEIRNKEK